MNQEKKILIVDDAVFMRAMVKRIITGLKGYTVFEAPDGETALKIYREEKPGLVLLDISMPGMNGIDVLKGMMAEDPAAFVVMCSAIGQESMMREAVDNGARDFIVKPFKPEQIVGAIHLAFPDKSEEVQNGEIL